MMLRPQLVADCCRAMREAVSTPITVKCRLGEGWAAWGGASERRASVFHACLAPRAGLGVGSWLHSVGRLLDPTSPSPQC